MNYSLNKFPFLQLIQGDITKQKVDVIVNAANSSLLGGGGVDGAIHRTGGPAILEECNKIVAKQGRCPAGEAVITTGGNLFAKYVIHTVGPIWSGGNKNEDELLSNCYKNSLALAHKQKCKTMAFPSISTGAYRFPIERAAKIALQTIKSELSRYNLIEVQMILFSAGDFEVYKAALNRIPA
jgi:O-acetyl-ADP-ribose deacetylase (regulator of RNase III)